MQAQQATTFLLLPNIAFNDVFTTWLDGIIVKTDIV